MRPELICEDVLWAELRFILQDALFILWLLNVKVISQVFSKAGSQDDYCRTWATAHRTGPTDTLYIQRGALFHPPSLPQFTPQMRRIVLLREIKPA